LVTSPIKANKMTILTFSAVNTTNFVRSTTSISIVILFILKTLYASPFSTRASQKMKKRSFLPTVRTDFRPNLIVRVRFLGVLKGGGDDVEMADVSETGKSGIQAETKGELPLEDESFDTDDFEELRGHDVHAPIPEDILASAHNGSWRPGRVLSEQEYMTEYALPPGGPLFVPGDGTGENVVQPPPPAPTSPQPPPVPAEEPAEDGAWPWAAHGLDSSEDPDLRFEDAGPEGEDAGPDYEDLVVPDMVEGVPAAALAVAHHSRTVGGALRRVVVRAGEHRWAEPLQFHRKWVLDIPPWSVPRPPLSP
jgi:hypothetical protein